MMTRYAPVTDVLVVDDSPNVRKGIAEALEDAGYAYELAENGAQGLQLALKNRYRLVITDLNMPVVGGLNLIATLRSREATRKLPVLVVTVDGEVGTVKRARDLGVTGYVLKPIDPDVLLAQVRKVAPAPAPRE